MLELRSLIRNLCEAPEKPDPTGFISLSSKLSKKPLGFSNPPIAYIGDTVADVKTVINARIKIPDQKFISLAIAIKGAESKPSLCSKTNFADGNSAPLTKPQPILR